MDARKSAALEKKELTSNYEELARELNSKELKEVERLLFGFPDFAFYFQIACREFHLEKKVVRFSGLISHVSEWEVIQPFEVEQRRIVPNWWSNYNKLKHDKISYFHRCGLGDLICAMAGLFVLVNYLQKYREGNPPVPNANYRIEKMKKSVVTLDCNFWSVVSTFFLASNASQAFPLAFILPELIAKAEFDQLGICYCSEICSCGIGFLLFFYWRAVRSDSVKPSGLGSVDYK